MAEIDLTFDETRLQRLLHGAVVASPKSAVFEIRGAGSLDCLQGLLTNDLVKPGPGSVVYGALLTPKGMIVSDAWILRRRDTITLVLPIEGRSAALEVFQRTLPPRLAQLEDRTGTVAIAYLLGDQSLAVLLNTDLHAPDIVGRVREPEDGTGVCVARVSGSYFHALLLADVEQLSQAVGKITRADGEIGDQSDLDAARILAGWPALGAEIDGRTLPQEVRFDQIGGVSYTKGCYVGQETVARVHFRGHPNRELRGLRWDQPTPLGDRSIMAGEKEVGTVRSTLALSDRRLGLAPIRREVALGDLVMAGGVPATVVPLPFEGLVEDAVS
jgi:folate-binding protein YgfZ